jgi:hypothetical protein
MSVVKLNSGIRSVNDTIFRKQGTRYLLITNTSCLRRIILV